MIQGLNNIFTEEQINNAKKLLDSLNTEQRLYLSGYLAGLNQSGALSEGFSANINQSNPDKEEVKTTQLTILYGTHTGNSKLLAEQAQGLAQAKGIEVSAISLQEYRVRKLKDETNLLVIVSTHGEGDPPVSAEAFYAYIFGKKAPKSNNLNFAVIGLGDSSYAKFCQTGKDIFKQLNALGGNAVHDFIGLDVDFKDTIADVLPQVVAKFGGSKGNGKAAVSASVVQNDLASDAWVEVEVLEKILLNGKGSDKETYHIELDIEGTGLSYHPGDALEVQAKNNPTLVRDILAKLNIDENDIVDIAGVQMSIKDALTSSFELTVVTAPVIKKYAEKAKSQVLDNLVTNDPMLQDYLYGADFLDVITDYPARLDASELATLLRKLPTRLYSISSSYAYNPDEVHITVGAVRYQLNHREHLGVCSGYLADTINEGDMLIVRVKPNMGFKLPVDNDVRMVMVGPGTGIAPFRSFLQEREAKDAGGKNWLFFGDQHFETDFLYQTELLNYRKKGVVAKLDVAFSRDQQEKVYVQDRMRENGEELYRWLNEGAHFYLCGDMKRMAKDVKETLLHIVKKYGQLTDEQALEYFTNLKLKGRFQEDVY
ncbi:sulfite reductase (NADPH) alpha subunit [Saccharicrinis carchari]|uniref:assimilatory sulfite reductase (NADPH) n=1 Tax=Saccharicrinis carchari TaxID=1168039 RepID=A0A521EQG3_SACCC|nr:assimilatory sulfite reductase (NADPH) flavoprotein subunit [Saccharicrinis carchari]SMO86189.1 sulfite reductase (NADPH) alpha subunit [Saccharicrinis carchari]